MQFADDFHRIADVLYDVPAYDFVKLVVGEWIGQVVQIVDDIGGRSRVYIHADCTRDFVRSATDVEHSADGSLLSLAGRIR